MIIISIMQYILAAIVGFLLGYQLLLAFFAIRAKRLKNFFASKKRKFAIVLPAHNEEQVISRSLYSLSGLVYPRNLYDLVVVADNCTDDSADIARNLGAIVLERKNEKEQGKGYALRWAFDQILNWDKDYDAIIVFDSDSLVSANYLEVINYYLDNGSKVIQSSDLVLPQPGVWSSESTRIGFLLYNYVKPLGRKALGLYMGLRGNGMCFSTDALRQFPWQAWSLTEDVEYGLTLQLKGMKIDFAPEANVWSQMPKQADNAETQRRRWEMGRYPIIKKFAPKLLGLSFQRKSYKYLDSFIDLITPPLVNLLLFVAVMCGINLLFWALEIFSFSYFLIWFGTALLGIAYLFVALYAAEADRQLYRSLLYIPIYVVWKVKLYVKSLRGKKERKWVRTTRESNDVVSKH